MLISQTTQNGIPAYIIEDAPIGGRIDGGGGWYLLHSAGSTVAIIPSPDGNGWEEIVVDESGDRDLWTAGFFAYDDAPGFTPTLSDAPPKDVLERVACWARTEIELSFRLRAPDADEHQVALELADILLRRAVPATIPKSVNGI
jgi:hypothetical protein